MRTPERNQEIIDRMSDDELIDFATTCSNRGVALAAEMHLRKRYPVSRRVKKLVSKRAVGPAPGQEKGL